VRKSRHVLPTVSFRFRPPADDWNERGHRAKDDERQDDDNYSDDEAGEPLALFHRIRRHRTSLNFDDETLRLIAARLAVDASRNGSLRDFHAEVRRLSLGGYWQQWGKLALGTHGSRIRAKSTEAESYRQRGRDTSHIKASIPYSLITILSYVPLQFFTPDVRGEGLRIGYGRVDALYVLDRNIIPSTFWEDSPLHEDQFFQRRRSLSFAIVSEVKVNQHHLLDRLLYCTAGANWTKRVIWCWDIIDVIGRITFDARTYIVD
jgi:hypothetical protein